MKNNYILISLVAVLAFSSCNNDFDGFGSVKKGDVIRFVATTSDSNTRTSYGDNKTDKGWPIYWVNGDNVRVVCPQAQETKTADFTVQNLSSSTNISSSTNNYTLTGENTLLWGETDEHHFYTFYPKERVYITEEETGTFTVAVPREQNAEVLQTGSESEGFTYTAVDMSAAVMAGHVSVKRSGISEGDIITLPFKPLTTALDIEVLAPETAIVGENAIKEVYITSITIANPLDNVDNRKALAGGFVYNAGANAGEGSYELYNNTVNNEDAHSTFVNVLLDKPVRLRTGYKDKLTVTAFLLPQGLPKSLRVMLNCRENLESGNMKVQSKLIESTKEPDFIKNNEGKKLSIKMGALPNPIIFSYETWMANLDEDVYVSQISLPGTHDAGAYPSASGLDNVLAQTQLVDIISQLNAGIRVLDFRPKYVNGTFNIAHGYVTYEDRTFDYVFEQAVSWLAEHPTEFIIVLLKNEFGSNTDSQIGWQTNMRNKLLSISEQYRIDTFDPEMTLKDARGKILFLSRDFYVGTDGDTSDHNHASWVGGKFDFGTNNNDYNAGLFGLGESFKDYWSTNVYTNENTASLGAILFISDLYTKTVIGTTGEILSPSAKNKKQCISKTIEAAYLDTQKRTWYLNFLNVSGTDRANGQYNEYAESLILSLSSTTYQRVGIIMLDWACPFKGSGSVTLMGDNGTSSVTEVTNSYKGYEVTKAIIDNNFKGGGPAKKSTVY